MNETQTCLRCKKPCRTGTPDPKARAIRHSSTTGFCPACMITKFLLSLEPVRDVIEGTPQRGSEASGVIVPARPGKGPEVLFDGPYLNTLRPVIAGVLAHTQLLEGDIDWIEVVGNWGMPWPRSRRHRNAQAQRARGTGDV